MNKRIAASKSPSETGQIYCEFRGRVSQYIKSRIANSEDAEDLLSCVFLKIHENIDTYDSSKASLSTWIYAITRNTVNDYFRRLYTSNLLETHEDTMSDYAASDLPAIDRLIAEEQLEKLGAALERLPERERDIIILRFYYERTSPQVAGMMNLSHENVRYLQHVAIGRLKKFFEGI